MFISEVPLIIAPTFIGKPLDSLYSRKEIPGRGKCVISISSPSFSCVNITFESSKCDTINVRISVVSREISLSIMIYDGVEFTRVYPSRVSHCSREIHSVVSSGKTPFSFKSERNVLFPTHTGPVMAMYCVVLVFSTSRNASMTLVRIICIRKVICKYYSK